VLSFVTDIQYRMYMVVRCKPLVFTAARRYLKFGDIMHCI